MEKVEANAEPDRVTVEPRFAGFPDRALGGYVCGALAGSDAFEVRLRAPVGLGVTLQLEEDAEGRRLRLGETVVAEGRPWRDDERRAALEEVPPAPSPVEAKLGAESYPGHHRHLFPSCFCCGPEREEGDGLRIFPGPLPGSEMVAAHWVPREKVGPEIVWAALDCPAIWAVLVGVTEADRDDHIVSGTMRGQILDDIPVGEAHIVYAWRQDRERGKRTAGAAIASEAGEVRAFATQVFVGVPSGVPLDPAFWQI